MSFLNLFLLFTASLANHPARPRIVGGTPTTPADYPYIASILYVSESGNHFFHFCGGSLITSPDSETPIVLTAAHCISDVFNETTAAENALGESVSLAVDFGRIRRKNDIYQGQPVSYVRLEAERWYIHQDYDESTIEHDIALIALEGSIDTSTIDVGNITWDVDTTLSIDDLLVVIGYGTNVTHYPLMESYPDSPTLEYLNKSYVDNDECNDLFNLYFYLEETDGQDPLTYNWTNPDTSLASNNGYNENYITDDMLCALTPDKDSCQGDSGGPIVIPSEDGDIQVGVVSFGAGCGDYGTPGVYSEVNYHRDWIRGAMACLYYYGGDDTYQTYCEAAENEFGTFISSLDEEPDDEDAAISLKYIISFIVVLFTIVFTSA